MAEFSIQDSELASLKGKIVVLTGGSSGIGLATVNLLLSIGASVVNGDIQAPAKLPDTKAYLFVKTNVTSWSDLNTLFKEAKKQYGRIDGVLANAGVAPLANYLDLELYVSGEPKAPSTIVFDINLKGCIDTATLAIYYLKQQPEGGSIVLLGSSTGLHPVRGVDYSSAKSGVWGFGGGIAKCIDHAKLPIRINTVMPSWTNTNLLPDFKEHLITARHPGQTVEEVARGIAYTIADESRHGEAIFIAGGKYREIQKAVLYPAYETIKGDSPSDDEVMRRIFEQMA